MLDRWPEFLRDVHGFEPMPWQHDLPHQLLEQSGDTVAELPAPPGLGKTVIIDAHVFALAASLASDSPRQPLRLALTVNRQLVVDSHAHHARRLADALADATDGVTGEVADRLNGLTGGDQLPPLQTVSMHGGLDWDHQWAPHPALPVVLLATPDQLVSRLLFRGYSTSTRMRPLDAALVAVDCRLVLDEAHESSAALQTLRTALSHHRHYRPDSPSRLVAMSATPRPQNGSPQLLADGYSRPSGAQHTAADDVQRQRLAAHRRLLVDPTSPSTQDLTRDARRFVRRATALATDYALPVVGVIVNTVAGARAIQDQLDTAGHQALLLTGRIRRADRPPIVARLLHLADPHRPQATRQPLADDAQPTFVVATQAIEIGVDLDFDGAVIEACALDALQQRLGRTDRAGHRHQQGLPTPVAVLATRHPDARDVYEGAARRTTEWLAAALPASTTDGAEVNWTDLRDAIEQLDDAALSSLQSPAAPAPALPIDQLHDWAHTRPAPQPDTDIAAYTHGLTEQHPTVNIAWRGDLDRTSREHLAASARRSLAAIAPRAEELVQVPLAGVLQWLNGLTEAAAVCIDADGTVHLDRRPRPGELVLAHPDTGGHDQWGWNPDSPTPVIDVTDHTADTLRLHPALQPSLDDRTLLALNTAATRQDAREHAHELLTAVTDRPSAWRAIEPATDPDSDLLAPLWVAYPRRPRFGAVGDSDRTSHTGHDVPLAQHLEAVANRARRYATQAGFDEPSINACGLAGLWHDVGKADPRFQAMLLARPPTAADPLVAKSAYPPTSRAAARAAGLPAGLRHETISQLAWNAHCRQRPPTEGVDAELIAHLIATHHGHHRPLPPVLSPGAAVDVDLSELEPLLDCDDLTLSAELIDHHLCDLDDADRFARLLNRYGPWQLAHLETIVQLADFACSKAGT